MKNNYYIKKELNIVTAMQVSAYLHIPLRTIYHLTKQGKIKGVKIGKHWRYQKSDIERYFSLGMDFSKEPARGPNNYIERGDRRSYPRINCHIECNLSIELPQHEEIMPGIIRNISGNGALIEANDMQASMEDPVDMRFVISVNGGRALIETKGRVVRKTASGFGVKFRDVDRDNQDLLTKYIG